MTCTACKYEFCWICSAKFNPTHFMESINCRVNEPGVDVPDYPVFHSTRCSGIQKSAPVKKKKKERVILPKIFSRIRRRLINQEAVHSTTEVVPKSKNGTYHYRFVALGRSGVGKSCVCYRYSNQSWVGGETFFNIIILFTPSSFPPSSLSPILPSPSPFPPPLPILPSPSSFPPLPPRFSFLFPCFLPSTSPPFPSILAFSLHLLSFPVPPLFLLANCPINFFSFIVEHLLPSCLLYNM